MDGKNTRRKEMAINKQNLKVPTSEEARKNGRKGGIASGEARRQKRDLKRAMEILLEKQVTTKKGDEMSGAEAIALKQFEKALKGDAKAFELVRDTAGQKPIEKIQVAEVEQSVIDEIERMIADDPDTSDSVSDK